MLRESRRVTKQMVVSIKRVHTHTALDYNKREKGAPFIPIFRATDVAHPCFISVVSAVSINTDDRDLMHA